MPSKGLPTELAKDFGGPEKDALSDLASAAFSRGRLAILRTLAEEPKRYTDIAAQVRGSESETSRHLQRLLAEGLTEKDDVSRFSATPLGAAVLRLSKPLESLASRADFFRNHDVRGLPDPFLFRLAETDGATVATSPLHVMAAAESVLAGVSTFFFGQWVLGKPALSEGELMMQHVLRERIVQQRADARGILLPGEAATLRVALPGLESYFAMRTMQHAPVALAISDGGAVLQFPDPSGRIDFQQALVGTDPTFTAWCRELFLDGWARSAPLAID